LLSISIRDLLHATLRHRPYRILVGEVWSGEAFDLFQTLNSGHPGGLDDSRELGRAALHRFTSSVLQSRVDLSHPAIRHGRGDASILPVHQAQRLLTDGDALGTRRAGTTRGSTGSDLE